MKIKAIAATAGRDRNRNKLSKKQLKDLARTAIGKNVTINFNPFIPPVGQIIGAEVTEEGLLVEAEIIESEIDGYYLAPSYSIDIFTRIVSSLDFALTKEHSDEGATEVEKEKV